MDSDLPDIQISDVVMSTAGRDQGEWFYVIRRRIRIYLFLANGERPHHRETQAEKTEAHKTKSCRSEIQTSPARSFTAIRYSTANYEGTWPFLAREMQVEQPGRVINLAKDDVIEIEGIVTDALPNAMFKVDIGNGHTILAHISGKLRMNFIKILPGDKVTVQMSPYDLTQGRITWRSK